MELIFNVTLPTDLTNLLLYVIVLLVQVTYLKIKCLGTIEFPSRYNTILDLKDSNFLEVDRLGEHYKPTC